MKELLDLMKKDVTAWDYYVPSQEDLDFIKSIEESLESDSLSWNTNCKW